MSLTARNAPPLAESSMIKHRDCTNGERLPGPQPFPKIVVTSPPWAKDEPEFPLSDDVSPDPGRSPRPSGTSITHVPSIISEHPSMSPVILNDHNRWKFALPRPRPKGKRQRSPDSLSLQSEKENPIREKRSQTGFYRPSRTRWPTSRKRLLSEIPQNSETEIAAGSPPRTTHLEALHLDPSPLSSRLPTAVSHNKTPGWDSPWTPRIPERVHANLGREKGQSTNSNDAERTKELQTADLDGSNPWDKRRKKLRGFLLNNTYVPLFLRIANITFTAATLAIAVRIRIVEEENHIRGAVGSSPVLAILFAPLTLVHVMVAIYLEYFGRPLGLWRTSAKLAHTLSEVVFICAWSAELALCFDNYFTSPLNCAPRSTVKWYSEFPFSNLVGNNATGPATIDARLLCASQRDLTGVVMVALFLYVTNLVISLFRIFEKVKIHQGWGYDR